MRQYRIKPDYSTFPSTYTTAGSLLWCSSHLLSLILMLDYNLTPNTLHASCALFWKAGKRATVTPQVSRPYPALYIFEFWKDFQAKAVSLASNPASSIHVVPKSQHQSHHLPDTVTLQQSLDNQQFFSRLGFTPLHVTSFTGHLQWITGFSVTCLAHLTDMGDSVELALNRGDPIDEGWLEDDTASSACEVRNLR